MGVCTYHVDFVIMYRCSGSTLFTEYYNNTDCSGHPEAVAETPRDVCGYYNSDPQYFHPGFGYCVSGDPDIVIASLGDGLLEE